MRKYLSKHEFCAKMPLLNTGTVFLLNSFKQFPHANNIGKNLWNDRNWSPKKSTHSLLKARTLINISIFIASTSDMMALSSNWPLFSFEMFFKILPIWCINENTLRIVDTLYIAQCYLFSPKYQGEKIPKFGQRGKERWNLLFYTPLRANNPPLPVLAPSRPSKHDKDSRTWVFSIFLSGKMPTL